MKAVQNLNGFFFYIPGISALCNFIGIALFYIFAAVRFCIHTQTNTRNSMHNRVRSPDYSGSLITNGEEPQYTS